MSDQASAPGDSDDAADSRDEEAAMMRKVMRMQERHREGGVDPDLADDAGPGE